MTEKRLPNSTWAEISNLTAEIVLGRLGIPISELHKSLGSVADMDRAYVVGSIAAGYGNTGSDVDLHVLTDDPSTGVFQVFVDQRPIDVQLFPSNLVRQTLQTLPQDTVTISDGLCALGPVPVRGELKRLSQWLYALPLGGGGTIELTLDIASRRIIAAVLTRAALDECLMWAFVAHLLTESNLNGFHEWNRAGRWLLEFMLRLKGELFVGEKWVGRKALRSDIDRSLSISISSIGNRIAFESAVKLVGLPSFDIEGLVTIGSNSATVPYQLGGKKFLLIHERRLESIEELPPFGTVTPALNWPMAADALGRQLCQFNLDEGAVSELLAP